MLQETGRFLKSLRHNWPVFLLLFFFFFFYFHTVYHEHTSMSGKLSTYTCHGHSIEEIGQISCCKMPIDCHMPYSLGIAVTRP